MQSSNEDLASNENSNGQHQGIPQDDFNNMAAAIKKKYYAKGQRDAQKQYEVPQSQAPQPQHQQYVDNSGMGSNDQAQYQQNPNDVAAVVQNEIVKMLEMAERDNNVRHANQKAETVAQQLQSKMVDASKRYPDYKNVLSNVGMFTDTPQILDLANGVDNAGDVLYHLAKSPNKIGNILALSQNSPKLAAMAIKELSGQIHANKTAASQPSAPSPVDPIRPSRVGTADGKPTISDYKREFRV